jgi:predicted nucleotidyltransferase
LKEWLQHELQPIRANILAAYLFGSSIKGKLAPRDVDLVIVTADGAGEHSWHQIISYRDHLRERFQNAFQIPLSTMVVTPSEWDEIDGIVVRERLSVFDG